MCRGNTMRVIKSGTPGGAWCKELKCTGIGNGSMGCGALLEVNGADLFHTTSSAMGERDHHVTFQCPECQEWTDVSSNLLPSGLANKIFTQPVHYPNKAKNDPL
jgi:hypothetical protein